MQTDRKDEGGKAPDAASHPAEPEGSERGDVLDRPTKTVQAESDRGGSDERTESGGGVGDKQETQKPDTGDEYAGTDIGAISGETRGSTEKKLRQALYDAVHGKNKNKVGITLEETYASQQAREPGLHVVVALPPFGLAWILGQPNAEEARYISHNGVLRQGAGAELPRLVKRYADDKVLAISIEDSAAVNRLFWNSNKDLQTLNQAACEACLHLFLLLSPAQIDALTWNIELREDLKARACALSPPIDEVFIRLIGVCFREETAKNLKTSAENANLRNDHVLLEKAFSDLCDKSANDLRRTLRESDEVAIRETWRKNFVDTVIAEHTREPAAAAALFIGANFPDLTAELFRQMSEIAFICAHNHWPEPAKPDPDHPTEETPRQWRSGVFDDAMVEVGLTMRTGPDGVRRAGFESNAAARFYAKAFAEQASTIEDALFRGIVGIGQPLDRGAELFDPFARLFARRIRDSYGQNARSDVVAQEIVEVIRWHRRDAEEALGAFKEEHEKLTTKQGDLIKMILTAVEAEKHQAAIRHLDAVAPEFIRHTLVNLRRDSLEDGAVETVEAIWENIRRAFPHADRDEQERRFWRQTVTGAMFAADTKGAITRLEGLFGLDPRALATMANGAYGGIRDGETIAPMTLLHTLDAASTAIDDATDKRVQAWRIGAFLALLTIWMHDSVKGDGDELAPDTFVAGVAARLLSKPVSEMLRMLPRVCFELDRALGGKAENNPWASGILSRQLSTARLRMLYSARGREFDQLATAVDDRDDAEGFRDPDRWSVDAGKAGYGRFDTWRRETLSSLGVAFLAKTALVRKTEPAAMVVKVLSEIPDAGKRLRDGSKTARRDLRLFDRAIRPDRARRETLRDLDTVLKTFDALTVTVSGES